MSKTATCPRIGVYGPDPNAGRINPAFGLWAPGYAPAVSAAGAAPEPLRLSPGCTWDEVLQNIDGILFAGSRAANARQQAEEERLCATCRELGLPFLGVDQGMHALNAAFGGTLYLDVSRELPEALQHRQPPEPGVRHAIAVTEGTRLAEIYGEGEIVVNSEHRRAVNRLARGFRVSARALDGVVEAIEPEAGHWFALGVQWQPASLSASGLDIQLFRGLVGACERRQQRRPRLAAAAA